MFFVLSKMLLFLLNPVFWVVLLFVWSYLTKVQTRKRRLRIAALIMLIIFTNPLLFHQALRAWQTERTELRPGQRYSAAIVLGGMSMFDRKRNGYFGDDADRFIQTTRLYHSGVIKKIVVSGGTAAIFIPGVPESDFLYKELLAQGVPDSNIIVENRSRNTFENAQYSKMKLDSLKLPPPYILVTSAMHMPRAKAVFNKAGLHVHGHPAAFKAVSKKWFIDDMLLPSVTVLGSWGRFLKEVAGLLVYRMTGKA